MKDCAASVSSKNPDHSASFVARFQASIYRLTSPAAVIETGASIDCSLGQSQDRRPGITHSTIQTPPNSKIPSLLIALSGGVDSVVLLSLAAALRTSSQCAVRAIYIDHGLQHQSAQWGDFCSSFCASLDVEFASVAVTVDLQSGLSPEAAARDVRYDALCEQLQPGEYLCTAHHADDQAETLLLQLFRGAGVSGLASMPELRKFGEGYLLRPLLHCSRADILRYASDYALHWCEDPSNTDLNYDRNYLRNELLPSVAQRWPQVLSNISRSASHCAETMELLRNLAELDLVDTGADSGAGSGMHTGADASAAGSLPLSVVHLKTLSEARKKNLLRYWIGHHGFQNPSANQLQQILNDLVSTDDEGAQGRINFGAAQIARYQETLFIAERDSFEPLADFEYHWEDTSVPLVIPELNWRLDVSSQQNLKAYAGQPLRVRNRRGGERWRPDPAGHSFSVKSLLQQRRIPPWQRSRIVLVFCDDKLVDICGPGFIL